MTQTHGTLRGSGAATRWGAAALGLCLVAALFVPAAHALAISTADDGPSISRPPAIRGLRSATEPPMSGGEGSLGKAFPSTGMSQGFRRW